MSLDQPPPIGSAQRLAKGKYEGETLHERHEPSQYCGHIAMSKSDAALVKAEAGRKGSTKISAFVRALALSSYMAPNVITLVLETVLAGRAHAFGTDSKLAADEEQADSNPGSRSEAISLPVAREDFWSAEPETRENKKVNKTFIRTVPPRAKGYGRIGLLLGLVVTVGFVFAWRAGLPEVQRVNLKAYAKASFVAQVKMPSAGVIHRTGASRNEYVRDVLRQQVYGGEELLSVVKLPTGGACCAVLFFILGYRKDRRFLRELRDGRKIDGPELQSRAEFNAGIQKQGEVPGVGLMLRNPELGEVRHGEEGRVLRIPFRHEPHHFSIAGAPGAGKTQLIIQLIDQVQDRAETDTAVIWDPTGV